MVFWLEPNRYPRGISQLTPTLSNQEVGRAGNRTRNGAFEKGSLFCDKGIQFSFGCIALVVLGVHTRADVWTILQRSAMDVYFCGLKPPLTIRIGMVQECRFLKGTLKKVEPAGSRKR